MREPVFWRTDGGRGSGALARALLSPLAAIYAWSVQRRIARTIPVDPGIPVICVGNITLGGTGKTPLSQAILQRLREARIDAQALSRGYGGRLKGPIEVDYREHLASDVGDEPLLLARQAPTWICADRPAGAAAAVEAGAQILVMDDGHQNPTLAKTLSLVVIDGIAAWGAGQVFPAGPLREPVTRGLARADAVIVMMPDADTLPNYQALGLADLEIPILHAWLAPSQKPPAGPLVGFAGIGRPQKFFDALQASGGQLSEIAEFPDHHPYSPGDLRRLEALAAAHEATLVTTEKDWVRLPLDKRGEIIAWPVTAEFANAAAFDALLQPVMDAAARPL
jgi:tetraacyldisaccharide 4'-kinase